MKELDKILSSTARHTGVRKADIISGNKTPDIKARGLVCHIIKDAYPHLWNLFQVKTSMSRQNMYNHARRVETYLKNADIRSIMNKIRADLKLVKIKDEEDAETKPNISLTKRLFGFDYTDAEEFQRRNAMIDSITFMNKMCSIGRQPMPDGMVYPERRRTSSCKSWYKE